MTLQPFLTLTPSPMIPSRALKSGVRKCGREDCGQVISGNKRFCLKHAIEEAKKAGLIAA
jgi:hypothetical protein